MKNPKRKGAANERRAQAWLERLGYQVERQKGGKYQKKDFFGLFDLIAVKAGEIKWVQVKSNQLPSKKYIKSLAAFVGPGNVELWVMHDRKRRPQIVKLRPLTSALSAWLNGARRGRPRYSERTKSK